MPHTSHRTSPGSLAEPKGCQESCCVESQRGGLHHVRAITGCPLRPSTHPSLCPSPGAAPALAQPQGDTVPFQLLHCSGTASPPCCFGAHGIASVTPHREHNQPDTSRCHLLPFLLTLDNKRAAG